MMTSSLPEALQAEHLTAVLRRDGVLGAAHVSEVEVESSRDTIILSCIIHLGLKYAAGAGREPSGWRSRSELDWIAGQRLMEPKAANPAIWPPCSRHKSAPDNFLKFR